VPSESARGHPAPPRIADLEMTATRLLLAATALLLAAESHATTGSPTASPTTSPTTSPTRSPTQYIPHTAGGCHDIIRATTRLTLTEQCALDNTTHEVRCCSDSVITGWTKTVCSKTIRGTYIGTIWHESDANGFGGCQHALNWTQARDLCGSMGAGAGRLCTRAEVSSACPSGTGCQHDNDLIWTSTSELAPPTSSPTSPTARPTASPTASPTPTTHCNLETKLLRRWTRMRSYLASEGTQRVPSGYSAGYKSGLQQRLLGGHPYIVGPGCAAVSHPKKTHKISTPLCSGPCRPIGVSQ